MKIRFTFILLLLIVGLGACSQKTSSGLSDQSVNDRTGNSPSVSDIGKNVTNTTSGKPPLDLNKLNEDVILSERDSSKSGRQSFKKSEQ